MEHQKGGIIEVNIKFFNIVGWVLLLGTVALWLWHGYTDWQIALLPASFLCFSIGNGKIKKLKWISLPQIMLLIVSLIIAVAIGFGLIQLAKYLINDVFHLHGILKTTSVWVSIIISLFCAVTPFSSIINKVDGSLKKKYSDSFKKDSKYDDLKIEANKMLNSMTKIETIKALRERYGLSLVDAKNIVDSVKQ